MNERYKALKLAAEEHAMLDENEMESHRQYFEKLSANTKEVQAKVQTYKQ